jgi:hypothetical protein
VSLNETYAAWKDRVNFFCVYIQEAHPKDGWQVPQNLDDDVIFYQPRSMQERAEIAQACMLQLNLEMPTLLDDIEDSTDTAYAALPERLYVIDTQGKVTFQCGPGPWGFDVEGWQVAIEKAV